MTVGGGSQLISVHPDELKFIFELEKQSYCDLKVANNTENHIAFKVKTTSPKKYFVRPNTGVVRPWDSCVIRGKRVDAHRKVTLQAQKEYPPDMQCKDKFLLQSTTVPAHTDADELPPDIFTKDNGGKTVEECKLKVIYMQPSSTGNSEDEQLSGTTQGPGADSDVQRLKKERDAAVGQTQKLQQELDLLKRRKYRKSDPGFSLTFAFFVGLIGIFVGFLLSLSLSSPPSLPPSE